MHPSSLSPWIAYAVSVGLEEPSAILAHLKRALA
jgi:hypothetical protein